MPLTLETLSRAQEGLAYSPAERELDLYFHHNPFQCFSDAPWRAVCRKGSAVGATPLAALEGLLATLEGVFPRPLPPPPPRRPSTPRRRRS